MIEVCGLIGGAATRLFVWASDYLNKKQTHEQDMERLHAQTELSRAQTDAKLSEALAARPIPVPTETDASPPAPDNASTGNSYLDFVNSAVRPALTYWYCLVLYTTYKGFLLYSAIAHNLSVTDIATEFDRTLIASMVSYWFTDRTFHRLSQ